MSKKNVNILKEEIKLILVGDSGVGKTSIINRYYLNTFNSSMDSTQSMNFIIKDILINGKNIQLNIWDTLGQEKYFSCNKLFIKNSNIVILVYDITRKDSFKNLDIWYDSINTELGKDYYLGLVGNKFDMVEEEEVSEEMGIEKAKEWGAYFSLLSAKADKEGIDNYFEELVQGYLEKSSTDFLLINSKNTIKTIQLERIDTIENKDDRNGCCSGKKNKKINNNLRIIFLGNSRVGKTNIIQAFQNKKINRKYEPTKNINKLSYVYLRENKTKINVKIIDTSGNFINDDNNDNIIKILRKCQIFFLVFDINKRNTFNDLEKYINQIKNISEGKKISICVLGNKININEENENEIISEEEARNFVKKFSGNYETVSIDDVNNIKNLINLEIDKYFK